MASRVLYPGTSPLLLAPLLSSTCTLLYARDQHFFLSLFNHPTVRTHSKPLINPYYKEFFSCGLPIVLSFLAVSAGTALANLKVNQTLLQTKGTFWWYVAGAGLSLGHLAYVPFIAPHVQTLVDGKEGEDLNEALGKWLVVNWRRMVTVDLGAWVAFVVAVVGTL
ncbi:hypothetical protein CGLO_06622 [Colletotrichum gloeosporioides Cg-14]|uniref:Integral membrane protein n=1 Tax=Colletotrichum gloeosporioides (strain Cg-14) TaxID=1237896 RepID=T0KLQ5_COLGC|nr:hypothetical protein CGLO_06622 [Colletotrichum gloeosporioides Cg-14]